MRKYKLPFGVDSTSKYCLVCLNINKPIAIRLGGTLALFLDMHFLSFGKV